MIVYNAMITLHAHDISLMVRDSRSGVLYLFQETRYIFRTETGKRGVKLILTVAYYVFFLKSGIVFHLGKITKRFRLVY